MSKVFVYFEVIDDLIKMCDVIVLEMLFQINGDVVDYQVGVVLVKVYFGLDGIMIGWGVFVNLFVFEFQF